MVCAACKKDFKESETDRGFYTQQNDHFMKRYRSFGFVCSYCGFHNTIISVPIEVPFIRSGRTFDKLDAIVAEFRSKVEEFYKERGRLSIQLSLLKENDTETK